MDQEENIDEGFFTPTGDISDAPILRPKPPHNATAATTTTSQTPHPSQPTFSLDPVTVPGNMAQLKRNAAFDNTEASGEPEKVERYTDPNEVALRNCGKELSQPLHSNDSLNSDSSILYPPPTEIAPGFTSHRDSNTDEKMFASIGDKPEVDETDAKMPLTESKGFQRQRKNAVRLASGNDDIQALENCKRQLTESLISDDDSTYMDCPSYFPPPYNESHYATIEDTSITEEKRMASVGDKAHVDKTDVKRPLSDDQEDGQPQDTTDDETEEKGPAAANGDDSELKRAIHELQEAQRLMADLQDKHDKMLRGLLQREPSVNKHFYSMKQAEGSTEVQGASSNTIGLKGSVSQPLLTADNSKLYAQLEQIYANLTRIHIPTKTVERVLGRRDVSYYNIANSKGVASSESQSNECAKLSTENADLKLKIEELEKKLKEQSQAQAQAHAEAQAQAHAQAQTQAQAQEQAQTHAQTQTASEAIVENQPAFVIGRPIQNYLPPLPQTRDLVSSEVSFKWTITNYMQKLKEEIQSAKQAEISPTFYLTHGGYKARLEAYLNGNGSGHNRNMSVFLRIIRGDYDNDLKWPLVIYVTFILMDQSDNGQSLRAGRNRFEYQRPSGFDENGNDCWGLIEFVSHEQIHGKRYVYDDKVALKCRIQFGDDLSGGSSDGKNS